MMRSQRHCSSAFSGAWGNTVRLLTAGIKQDTDELQAHSESRQDQEELDSHEEVRHFCGSRQDQEEGGELDSHEEVRLFGGSRQDQEEGGGVGPSVSPEQIKCREVELGFRVGLLLLQLFPSGGATDNVFATLFLSLIHI